MLEGSPPARSDLFDLVDGENSIRDIELDLPDKDGITKLKRLQAELTRLDRLNLVGQVAAC